MSVSKSAKPILIGVIVIVVAALAILAFTVIFPPKEEPQLEEEPADTAAEEVYYVIKEDGNTLTQIKAFYADGETLTINYERDENGKLSYHVEPEATFFEYNTSKFRSMMFTMTSLNAVKIVSEHPENLADYGLDEPQFRMQMSFEDGHSVTLYVGDPTPVDRYYYAKTDASDTVYVIGNYITSLLMRSELEYRNIATFPQYTEDDIYSNINWLRVTKRDGTVVEVVLDTDFSMEGNKASSSYMLLSPVVSSCTDELVQSKLLDVAATITFGSILQDITPAELADYGFENPGRFEISDVEGNTLDLVVGGSLSTGLDYVIMGEQYDAYLAGEVDVLTLLSYSHDAFGVLDIDYTTLLNRAIWIQNIHEVKTIIYDMAGTVYTMEMDEYDDVTGSGVEVVRTVGTINGKSITETNTKRLYSRTLNLREVGEVPADAQLGDVSYTITLVLKDGSTRKLEMLKLNERQYACRVDGVTEFYIYRSNIETLITALERVMDDRNVSLVYTT